MTLEQIGALALKLVGIASTLIGGYLGYLKYLDYLLKKAQIKAGIDIAVARETSTGLTAINAIREDIEDVKEKFEKVDEKHSERFRELGNSIEKLREHFTETLVSVLKLK